MGRKKLSLEQQTDIILVIILVLFFVVFVGSLLWIGLIGIHINFMFSQPSITYTYNETEFDNLDYIGYHYKYATPRLDYYNDFKFDKVCKEHKPFLIFKTMTCLTNCRDNYRQLKYTCLDLCDRNTKGIVGKIKCFCEETPIRYELLEDANTYWLWLNYDNKTD